jgi:hypothetical protein
MDDKRDKKEILARLHNEDDRSKPQGVGLAFGFLDYRFDRCDYCSEYKSCIVKSGFLIVYRICETCLYKWMNSKK